jgi:hypothetical protein
MSTTTKATGTCLCGEVKIIANALNTDFGACHCDLCKTWGGGAWLSVVCGREVTIEGEENVSVYSSSDWAERGFCKACGTHLFYRFKEKQQYHVPIGLFTDLPPLHFSHQIFIESKPAHYSFANETKNMTGAEVFALYAPD